MAITRVQGNSAANSGPGTSLGVTISAVGSGNCICGLLEWVDTSATLTSITDDKGNTYNLETKIVDSASQAMVCFSKTNITNGPVTITANWTAGNATFRKIVVDEFSGISAASTDERDGSAHGGQGQASAGTGTNAITSGTFTTSTDGDLLYGACVGSSTGAALASNGTNYGTGTSALTADDAAQSEFRIQATAGSGTAATFTQAVNTRRMTVLIAIKAIPAVIVTPETPLMGQAWM